MDNNFSIGNRIRELRLRNHLSQEQLAFAADITTVYLGQLERNEKNPTVSVVMKISNALGIELSEFFSEKMFLHNEIDPISMQILHQLKNQDDEVKEIILQLIKQAIKLRAT
jgi:transcriptional regulator with XRE-family HTH domain